MAKPNPWQAVSDLMTGLMLIFLFIAIAYMKEVQDESKNQYRELQQYVDNKRTLQDTLFYEFRNEQKEGTVRVGTDLSMRFENAEVMFLPGQSELTASYKKILADIIPRYLDILLQSGFKDKIREIRIEGHTDDTRSSLDPDPYIGNLILSQKRALSVMQFIRSLPEVKNYSDSDKEQIEYWFTANGLSYGRALDENGELIHRSQKPISRDLSRRVEFRIIAAGEEVFEDFVKKKDNNQ